MPGIFERFNALAGSEMEKAATMARQTFQSGVDSHGHHGRALIETLARLCREHPNLVGVAVGVLVEHLLTEEQREYNRRHAQGDLAMAAPDAAALPPPAAAGSEHDWQGQALARERRTALSRLRPGRIALEVFGGLLLLKFGLAFGRLFRRKRPDHDSWLAAAARIHLISASMAAYYFAKALRSPKVSAWRNAAIGLFGTDAIKPLLKPQKALAGRAAA